MPSKPIYDFRTLPDESRDIMAYEVKRDDVEKPWTVIVYNYSKVGHKQFFSDIFFSKDWDEGRGSDGGISNDVRFCINLWRRLGLTEELGEEFSPKHIEHDLTRYPAVYRRCIEDVMARIFNHRGDVIR